MRIALIALCLIAAVFIWFLLADRFFLGPPVPQPVAETSISEGNLVIGSRKWPLTDPLPSLFLDRSARVVMYTDGRAFTFGPLTKRWEAAMQFSPDPDDNIQFTRRTSRAVLPMPYFGLFNPLGGSAPKWHRTVYDHLRWVKSNGATLDITWQDEQRQWPKGWQDEYNNQVTKLMIELSPVDKAATDYLTATRKWSPKEYRLESQGTDTVAAIWLEDENGSHPGSGRSVQLKLHQGKVVGETAWQ